MLHVVGRRADGYHLLESVFQFLDLHDEIRLASRADGAIRRLGGLDHVPEEKDLTVRAARALKASSGCLMGADIGVTKRIPDGGGLGGGSSDAATVLLGLNRLWGLNMSLDELARIGLELGADVPVFVRGFAAWAEGVGEQLTPIPLDEPWFVVVHPGVHVPTAKIFQLPELTRDTSPMTMRGFLAQAELADVSSNDATGFVPNDLQSVVVQHFPEVGRVLSWLAERGERPPVMTGSGSCVFMVTNSAREAEQIVESLPGYWSGFAARGLNRSSLHRVLFDQPT